MVTLILVTFGLGVALNLEAVTYTDVYIQEKLPRVIYWKKMKGSKLRKTCPMSLSDTKSITSVMVAN